jgi:hypothetical protein
VVDVWCCRRNVVRDDWKRRGMSQMEEIRTACSVAIWSRLRGIRGRNYTPVEILVTRPGYIVTKRKPQERKVGRLSR